MGEEQQVTWQELLARNRARVRGRHRLHGRGRGGVRAPRPRDARAHERFEEVQAAAKETELEPNLVGELIASEVEVRTGRCEDFAEAAARWQERRASSALARELQLALGATGTHPWSRWQDQRIIDTPHYRRNDEILRYVVWRNNTFGLHVHVGIAGADRAIAVRNALRNFLPELLALSASSPFVEGVDSGLHSARTEIFTRCSRAAASPMRTAAGTVRALRPFLYHTGSITSTRRSGGACARTSRFRPSRSASATPSGPRRGAVARRARLLARCALARALRRSRAGPSLPHRLIEEYIWRAIRYGLSGELIDLEHGEPSRAARRSRACSSGCCRSPTSSARLRPRVPRANAAERQLARFEEGASLEEIFAEQVPAGEPIGG